jgi:hypothetical protein
MTEVPVPGRVYRVQWVPGTDHLLGECFCRAQHVSDDPLALWDWLYGHPHGHDVRPVGPLPTATLLTGVPG